MQHMRLLKKLFSLAIMKLPIQSAILCFSCIGQSESQRSGFVLPFLTEVGETERGRGLGFALPAQADADEDEELPFEELPEDEDA